MPQLCQECGPVHTAPPAGRALTLYVKAFQGRWATDFIWGQGDMCRSGTGCTEHMGDCPAGDVSYLVVHKELGQHEEEAKGIHP